MGLAHGLGKVQEDIHRVTEGLGLEDLGADVAVEALHVQVGLPQGRRHEAGGLAGLDGHAELAVDPPGVDGLEGVGVDPRGHPEEDPLADAPLPGGRVQPLQLPGVVHDEAPHPAVQGIGDVLIGLVVAVKVEPLRGEAPGQGGIDLPGGDHVGPHALLLQHGVEALEAQGLPGEEGHGPLGHGRSQGLDIGPAVGPDPVLVHHVQGGAKFTG